MDALYYTGGYHERNRDKILTIHGKHKGSKDSFFCKQCCCVISVCITVLLDPYGCKMQLNK
jgi:hypothetical protein